MSSTVSINGTTWTALTSAGELRTMWIKTKPAKGQIVIAHSQTGPESLDISDGYFTIASRRKFNFLIPDGLFDVYYARCSHEDCVGELVLDMNLGFEVPVDQYGNVPVSVQDQTTLPIAARFIQVINPLIALAADVPGDTNVITLSPGHGVTVGDDLVIITDTSLYFTRPVIVAGDVLTVDTPAPFFLPAGTQAFSATTDMNVDGSVTRQEFILPNPFPIPIDITRMIIHMTDGSPMDDGLFGSLPELDYGIVFRKRNLDGTFVNFWNAKTNGRLGELAFDKIYDAKAPAGLYGLSVRVTYAGQEKHGVAIRVYPGEQLELLVQDDLSTLTEFNITLQGHISE